MTAIQPIDPAKLASAAAARNPIGDDKAMLRAAVELTRDLGDAKPSIYWSDMLASVSIGYAALAGAIVFASPWLAVPSGVIAVLALYRALSFIHELTHIHRTALPGFRTAWNLLVGIPMLTPSFMYEGVHTLHHARTRYGTAEDPEYLPLALMTPLSLLAFILISLLAPPALIIRSAILVPLGVVIPPLRTAVWERMSALSINPGFRRRPPEGELVARAKWQQFGATIWALTLIGSIFALGWRPLLIAMAVFACVALLNQLRTLVAHLWENDGEAMSVTAQYLDSVNVPPPSIWAAIWAPVGLRYHATHHLLPSMPYHSLGTAHKRLSAHLAPDTTYWHTSHKGLSPLVWRIARSTMGRKSA